MAGDPLQGAQGGSDRPRRRLDHTEGASFNISLQECIAKISDGDQYYVVASNGDVAAVVVAQMQGAPGPLGTTQYFIKTEADDAVTKTCCRCHPADARSGL